jgi:hypothetical protein
MQTAQKAPENWEEILRQKDADLADLQLRLED